MTPPAPCCPNCGFRLGPTDPTPAPASDPVADLRAWCESRGHWVSADGRCYEDAAAEFLGVAAGTLRNWRAGDRPLPFHRTGAGRGRVSYALGDLVAHAGRRE